MQLYLHVMRKNIFLVLGTFLLLILMAGFWYGVPLFGLTGYFYAINVPRFIQFISICLGVGFSFSLFLIPLHLLFAKTYSKDKSKGLLKTFLITQGISIVVVSLLFAGFYLIVVSLITVK